MTIAQIRLYRFIVENETTYIVKDSTYNTYSFEGRHLAVVVLILKADNGESDPSHRSQSTDHIHGHDPLPLEKFFKISK